jgi:hypothetical protein
VAAPHDNRPEELDAIEACTRGSMALGALAQAPDASESADEPEPPRASRRARGRHLGEAEGFSIHAGVTAAAGGTHGRELLLRYCARPPIALGRLSRLPDGRIAYRLKKPWRPDQTDMARRADALVERSSDTVRRYYRDTLSALMGAPQARLIYFVDVTGGIQARIRDFDYLDRFADADEAQRIAELRELFRAKLEADAHFTLQRALRWWIYGHVPTVGLLVVLVVIHIMSIVYF